MTTTKPRFHGRCRLGRWLPLAEVLSWPREQQPDTTSSRWDRGQGCEVAAVQCDFETEDPTFFDAHMATVHGRRISRQIWPGNDYSLPVKMWKGPKLTADGKPFEPKDLEPGATVTWSQLVPTGETYFDDELGRRVDQKASVERTGQVWSGAPYPRSAWVIPHEPLEDERAVCLKAEKSGELYEHLTWAAKDGRRMAGAA